MLSTKKSIKQKHNKHYTHKNTTPTRQQGGVLHNATSNNNLFIRNPAANLHNINPQASLDLDSAFMSHNGSTQKLLKGGEQSDTFKHYLTKINNKLDLPLHNANMSSQSAGGFTSDPSEFIAGKPVIKGYDDCCPPALINGSYKFGEPNTPVCGIGAMRGGIRHKYSNNKKNISKKHKTHSSKKHKKHISKKQTGGDWTTFTHSKPANYDSAFNGPQSVFVYPDDMTKRAFDERQPNYSPNAI